MDRSASRRQFLKTAGTAASLSVLGTWLPTRSFATTIGVRRNVGNMAASDPVLLTYRKAIKAMKALPASDPRSWSYQAAIHGTHATPVLTAWNTCEHSSRFFWSWHRMYLYWFERICRHMAAECCDPCWCLPYWDWASPTQRKLPEPFRDTTSELYESHRNSAMNAGTGFLLGSTVDLSGCWPMTDFFLASGAFSGPHGGVHLSVGGYMHDVPTAAQDPIFYLHHANVDRQWNLWLAQGARTDPLGDAAWKSQLYTFFDEHGVQVQMNSCQVIRAAEQLSYVYEGEPTQVKPYCERHRWPWKYVVEAVKRFDLAPITLQSRRVNVDLPLADVRAKLAGLTDSDEKLLLLELDDVMADRSPDTIWEVYLGAAGEQELREGSPMFLGIIALFGDGVRDQKHGDHGAMPAHFAFPVRGELLKRISKAGKSRLTFVPRDVGEKDAAGKADARLQVGKIQLSLQTRMATGEQAD
jgi:hypothetical protein